MYQKQSLSVQRPLFHEGVWAPRGIKLYTDAKNPQMVVRCLYYAFVFSLPFEAADIGIGSGNLTLAKILGYIFIASTVLQPRSCYRLPPKPFWCFATYLFIYVNWGFLQQPEFTVQIFMQLFTLVQMVVLFWVSYNLMV